MVICFGISMMIDNHQDTDGEAGAAMG